MIRRLVLVLAASIGATLLVAGPAAAAPASCAGVKATYQTTRDSEYTIFPVALRGRPITVYCYNMRGTPREYLTLPHTEAGRNYAQYTAGGASPGTDVITRYRRLRFDPNPVTSNPHTFRVQIADQTFASSTGELTHGADTVTSMPYAVAFDCLGPASALGRANIDLRGTLYRLVDTFSVQGFQPAGSMVVGWEGQLVDVGGGGYCGWNAPADMFNPYNQNPLSDANRGWDLRIALLG